MTESARFAHAARPSGCHTADPLTVPLAPLDRPIPYRGRTSRPLTILVLLKRVDCIDGVAAYLESLTTGLRERGDRVLIVSGDVTTPDGSEARRLTIARAALDWVVLDGLSTSRPRLSHLRVIFSLIRLHQVDVLSPQGFSALPIAHILGRLSVIPIVTNFHLLQLQPSIFQRLAYRVVNAVCRSDRYLAMSDDIAAFFRNDCRISQHQIHKQVLGVDTEFYRPPTDDERSLARARFGLRRETLTAVLPGRMNRAKGHDLATAALRILRTRRPELLTVCLFAGGGGERERIEAATLLDEADRATFRFLGFVDRKTMRDAYWAADIVLLPSSMEGFPLVVCEAMCCGAIVIRTPSSGWQEQVVEGRTGYLVPFNDPVALAAAIEKVADSPGRALMREEAMRLASTKFSKSRMIDGTSALYREVVALRSPRRADRPDGWNGAASQPKANRGVLTRRRSAG